MFESQPYDIAAPKCSKLHDYAQFSSFRLAVFPAVVS